MYNAHVFFLNFDMIFFRANNINNTKPFLNYYSLIQKKKKSYFKKKTFRIIYFIIWNNYLI